MYTLTRMVSRRALFLRHAPTLAASLVVAELLYKFHSFTLECLAFLGTWFVLDGVVTALVGDAGRRHALGEE